jgi:hypothetical protein
MRDHDRPRTDLRAFLERVEAASPTDAIEVVTDELVAMFGAHTVSFLIADFSGRSLVRFSTPPGGVPGTRRQGTEQAEELSLAGTVYDRVLRTQQADVRELAEGTQLTVPVTDRGDAIGVIELILPRHPDGQVIAAVTATAHALAYVVIANRRHTDLFEWGQRTTPFSLAAEIQRRLLPTSYTLRGRPVHSRRLAGTGQHRRRGHLRLQPRPREAPHVDHRCGGPRGRGGVAGNPPGRQPA